MAHAFVSLLWIVAVAFLAPLISLNIPHRIVPETVLLILGGLLIGPSALAIADKGEPITFLSELGLGFLFLMAGYEIDVNELRGSGGRHATIAWFGSLALAFATVTAVGVTGGPLSANGIAIAIAMTSTAIGTILPILRERGLLPTAVGAAILNHGAVGEVGPVILMALLLGSRSTWQSAAVLALFLAIALLIVRFTDRVKAAGQRLVALIHLGGSTTAQTTIRVTVLLLVGLCALAEVFDLDVVLGAFAAGFILRYAVPDGNRELEEKLDGLAYGFFVPIFFVTSGMAIELEITTDSMTYLGAFLVLLVLTRGLPVWLSARLERRRDGLRAYSMRQCLQIATYSTTALPIIVAVTQVAVTAGAMSPSIASTLVLAGAVSVLLMPLLGLALGADADHVPAVEALAIVQGPVDSVGSEVKGASTSAITEEDGEIRVASKPRQPAYPSTVEHDPNDGAARAATAAGRLDGGTDPQRAGGTARHVLPSLPKPLPGLRRGESRVTRLGLSEEEAAALVERLRRVEEERTRWREQMRRQIHLDREESQQRRAVMRAQHRAQVRKEWDELRDIKRQVRRARRNRDS
ncbi:cation:proton antiporter [Actinomyces gaoshouyii]|uniref:Cation/H+ exchanger transmembrane domain-containing protein n=1 Tax=Actinomyces gaoshouyii TaxID=1960083 RepID=A0A8H9LHQ2_9ACTO|nr:cation:proton antiporter [Actinomyces gaoshouyii]ARD41039.1 sodium:proton antiporter [Actinomyces gaoshouyii]GGO94784.1 hypothetical protein GCM10011612_01050 [Actinomyces gaoshouyii]